MFRKALAHLAATAALASVLAPTPAAAQASPLRWDPPLDAALTGSGGVLWAISELLKPQLAPSRCRWCSVDALDAEARDALVWRDTAAADTLSDITGFVAVPVAMVGLDALAAARGGTAADFGQDVLFIAEAAVATAVVTQLAKMLVARERPFVHALPSDRKPLRPQPSDNNLSFFSGHASETFAMTTAAGTVATMRGYRSAPVVWSVGGLAATTTAYLRIAADKHWMTDVLVGALVGACAGFALPFAFHSQVASSPPSPPSARSTGATGALPALILSW